MTRRRRRLERESSIAIFGFGLRFWPLAQGGASQEHQRHAGKDHEDRVEEEGVSQRAQRAQAMSRKTLWRRTGERSGSVEKAFYISLHVLPCILTNSLSLSPPPPPPGFTTLIYQDKRFCSARQLGRCENVSSAVIFKCCNNLA